MSGNKEIKDGKGNAAETENKDSIKESKSNLLAYIIITIGIVIAVISLIILIPGNTDDDNAIMYGMYRFEKDGPFYVLDYQKNNQLSAIQFNYLPQEVMHIPVYGSFKAFDEVFYLSFQPDASNRTVAFVRNAFIDASRKFIGVYGQSPRVACTNHNDEECLEYPIVTCELGYSGIVFYESQEPFVVMKDNCVEIYGYEEDILKAEHLFMYWLLGIVRLVPG